jgi:hypothetical protein
LTSLDGEVASDDGSSSVDGRRVLCSETGFDGEDDGEGDGSEYQRSLTSDPSLDGSGNKAASAVEDEQWVEEEEGFLT